MSSDSKSWQNELIDATVRPDTTVQPETTISPGNEADATELDQPDIEIDQDSELYEPENNTEGGIGQKLRDIEGDGFVSDKAARNTGLALMVGSALYINEQARDIGDAIEESLPEGISVEEYVPEEAEELPAEIESLLDEGIETVEDIGNLPELPDYSAENLPVDLEYIDPSEYESELEELLTEADPVIDEVVDKLNTNVSTWEEMGIDPSENIIEQLDPETVADAVLISFDNLTHLAVTGTMSNMVAQAADRYTDRESVIAAAGMSTALAYAVAKEGFYEGGAGMQFNPGRLDVQGDWISDTVGAAWGTWSYLQNRAKEETLEGERDTGISGAAAHKMGRAYEKARYMAQTNLPTRMFQYNSDEDDQLDVGLLRYDIKELDDSQLA